jgi:MinD-like ATPase involved in chromosome partitioning or flagellar assembly
MTEPNPIDQLFGSNPIDDLFPELDKEEAQINAAPEPIQDSGAESSDPSAPSIDINRSLMQMMEMMQQMQARIDQLSSNVAPSPPAQSGNEQLALPAAPVEKAEEPPSEEELAERRREQERAVMLAKLQEARQQREHELERAAQAAREAEAQRQHEFQRMERVSELIDRLEAGEELSEEELEFLQDSETTIPDDTAQGLDVLPGIDDLFSGVEGSAPVHDEVKSAEGSTSPEPEVPSTDDLFEDIVNDQDTSQSSNYTSKGSGPDNNLFDDTDNDDLFENDTTDTATTAPTVSTTGSADDLFGDTGAPDDLFDDLNDDLFGDEPDEAPPAPGAEEGDLVQDSLVRESEQDDDLFADMDDDDLFGDEPVETTPAAAVVEEDDPFADMDDDDLFGDGPVATTPAAAVVEEDDPFADMDDDDLFGDEPVVTTPTAAVVEEDDPFADMDDDDLFGDEPVVTTPSPVAEDDPFADMDDDDLFGDEPVATPPSPVAEDDPFADMDDDDLFGDEQEAAAVTPPIVAEDDDDLFGDNEDAPAAPDTSMESLYVDEDDDDFFSGDDAPPTAATPPAVIAPTPMASLPKLRDPFYLIARQARDSAALGQTKVLDDMRSTAAAGVDAQKKGSGRTPRMNAFPWEKIERGNPLIISVTSPKGGSGKSSTAMNLAALIASNARLWYKDQLSKKNTNARLPRILVFDGDIGGGTLAIRTAGVEEPNVIDLINDLDAGQVPQTFEDLKREYLLVRDEEELNNLAILAAPADPDAVEDLKTNDYGTLMNLLREFYDVIIIDTGIEMYANFNKFWAQSAHAMYVLTLPETVTLYKAAKFIDYVTNPRAGKVPGQVRPALVGRERINLVVMQSDADWGIQDVHKSVSEYFLNMPSDHIFYFNDVHSAIIKTNNAGDFLALKTNTREGKMYARNIFEIAQDAFTKFTTQRR